MKMLSSSLVSGLLPFLFKFFSLGEKLVRENKYLFFIGIFVFYRLSMLVYQQFEPGGFVLFPFVILSLFLFFSPQLKGYFTSSPDPGTASFQGIALARLIPSIFGVSLFLMAVNLVVQTPILLLTSAWLVFCLPILAEGWGKSYDPSHQKRVRWLGLGLMAMGGLCVASQALLSLFFIPFLVGVFGFHYFRDLLSSDRKE